MTFIKTISEEQAEGLLQDQYQAAQKNMGYVPNYIKAFSLHSDVYDSWTKLIGAIRSKMRLRRHELVTFASAMALECRYCMLAHGTVLLKNFFSADELYEYGLSDEEILDVILTSAARSFFSKTLNAAGAIPDEAYLELEPELLQVLKLGHPFA